MMLHNSLKHLKFILLFVILVSTSSCMMLNQSISDSYINEGTNELIFKEDLDGKVFNMLKLDDSYLLFLEYDDQEISLRKFDLKIQDYEDFDPPVYELVDDEKIIDFYEEATGYILITNIYDDQSIVLKRTFNKQTRSIIKTEIILSSLSEDMIEADDILDDEESEKIEYRSGAEFPNTYNTEFDDLTNTPVKYYKQDNRVVFVYIAEDGEDNISIFMKICDQEYNTIFNQMIDPETIYNDKFKSIDEEEYSYTLSINDILFEDDDLYMTANFFDNEKEKNHFVAYKIGHNNIFYLAASTSFKPDIAESEYDPEDFAEYVVISSKAYFEKGKLNIFGLIKHNYKYEYTGLVKIVYDFDTKSVATNQTHDISNELNKMFHEDDDHFPNVITGFYQHDSKKYAIIERYAKISVPVKVINSSMSQSDQSGFGGRRRTQTRYVHIYQVNGAFLTEINDDHSMNWAIKIRDDEYESQDYSIYRDNNTQLSKEFLPQVHFNRNNMIIRMIGADYVEDEKVIQDIKVDLANKKIIHKKVLLVLEDYSISGPGCILKLNENNEYIGIGKEKNHIIIKWKQK